MASDPAACEHCDKPADQTRWGWRTLGDRPRCIACKARASRLAFDDGCKEVQKTQKPVEERHAS